MSEPPILLVFALCDQVVIDSRSGKRSINGIFNEIHVNGLPVNYGKFELYFSFTNWIGTKKAKIRIKDPEDIEIFNSSLDYKSDSPLNVMEEILTMENLVLRKPGLYDVDILIDGAPACMRQFLVVRDPLIPMQTMRMINK